MAIPGFPQLPVPNIGQFLPLPQGSSSPFNNQQQNQLIAIANGIPNFNSSLVTSGSTDLYNTEQYLIQNNQSLLSVIQSIANLTTDPQKFISSIIGPSIVNNTNFGLPSFLYTALGSPNNFPKIPTTTSVATLGGRTTSTGTLTGPASGPTGVSIAQTIPIATFSLPSAIRPFVNAIAGQTGSGTGDFWSVLNALYNFSLNSLVGPNAVNFAGLSSIINGFNVGNLLGTGGVSNSNVPYLFPLQNGDSFANFIQMLLTFGFSPGAVISQIMFTPVSNTSTSFAYNAYQYLSAQPPNATDPTGQGFAQYTRPLVNILFGANPSTVSTSDPFDTLYNFVINGLPGLFSTNGFTGTSITPRTLIDDLINGNTTQFQSDVLSVLLNANSGFENIFIKLFPNGTPFSGSPLNGVQTLLSDMFNGKFASIPCDLLGLVNISTYIPTVGSNPISNVTSLCDAISGLFTNIFSFSQNLFVGNHPGYNFIGYNDSVQYRNIPNGENAGSASPGWGSSTLPANIFGGANLLNGQLQGDLGAAVMLALAAAADFESAVSNTKSSASSFFNINFAGSAFSAGTALKQTLSGGYFVASSVSILASIVAQLVAAIANIKNVLNNAGIPTGIGSNATNFNMPNVVNIL